MLVFSSNSSGRKLTVSVLCCGERDEERARRNYYSDGDLKAEMLKFGSKSDVTVVHRATIRLLDDAEIIHCDFQVRNARFSRGRQLSSDS